MAITFNHNDQVYVKDGNLGVGTDNPTYKLTVQGSVNLAGTGAYLRWNSGDMQISNDGSYKMGFYTYNTTAAALVNRMVIDTSGNVGIGDTAPSFILDVNNTSSRVRFKAATGDSNLELSSIAGRDWLIQSKADGVFRIYDEDAAAARLSIDTSGNIQLPAYGAGVLTTDSAGNVGVSTGYQTQSTADGRYVNVTGDTMTGQLIIQNTGNFTAAKFKGTDANGYGSISIENDLGTALVLGSMGSTNTGTFFDNARYIGATSGELVLKTYSSTDGHIKFLSGGQNERMRIDKGGNVGIGTTGPEVGLHYHGAVDGEHLMLISNTKTYGTGTGINETAALGFAIKESSTTSLARLFGKIIASTNAETDSSAGTLTFQVRDSGSLSTAMTIKNTGNVGIGTGSPDRNLHVKKSNSGGQVRMEVFNSSNTANSHGVISIYSGGASGGDPFLHWKIDAQQDWSMGIDNSDADKLKISKNFGPGTNDYLTVDTSGNVGIGTTGPNYPIDLQKTTSPLTLNLKLNKASTTNDYAEIAFQLWSGAGSGENTFGGTGTSRPSVVLRAINENGGSAAGALVVGTFTGGANNSNLTEKFRITSAGNVGIGITNPSSLLHLSSNNSTYESNGILSVSGGVNAVFNSTERFIFNIDSDNTQTDRTFDIAANRTGSSGGNLLFRVQENGNVGIGTTSPSAKLDVDGYARFAKQYREGGFSALGATVDDWYTIADFSLNSATYTYDNFKGTVNWGYGGATSWYAVEFDVYFRGNNSIAADGAYVRWSYRQTGNAEGKGGSAIRIVRSDDVTYEIQISPIANYGVVNWEVVSPKYSSAITLTTYDTIQTASTALSSSNIVQDSNFYVNGNVGIGTTNPGAKLTIVSGGKGIHVDKGSHSSTSANLSECRTNYGFAYDTLRNGSTTGFFITNVGTNTPAMQAVDSSNNAQNISIQPYGGNVGIGDTGPSVKLQVSTASPINNVAALIGDGWVANSSYHKEGGLLLISGTSQDATQTGAGIAFQTRNTANTNYWKSSMIMDRDGAIRFTLGGAGTVAGSEDFTILSGGNVGINTSSPGERLDVVGNIRSYSAANNYGQIQNGSFLAVGNHSGTFMLDLDNNGTADLVNIKKSGTSRFYIENGGNVGIGTTSPGVELDVAGGIRATAGTANGLRVHTNSGITASNNYMNFFTSQSSGWAFNANGTGADSTTKVVITSGGNVGIGTTSPTQKLQVGASTDTISYARWVSTTADLYVGANSTATHIGVTNGAKILQTGSYPLVIGTTANQELYLGANNAIIATLVDGKMGIGTTSPSEKLEVTGNVIRVNSDAGGFYQYTSAGVFRSAFYDNGTVTQIYADGNGSTPVMTFNSGKVGIGTTAPQQALHIKGATNGLMMLEGDNDNGIAGCYYKTEDTDDTMNRTKGFFGFQGNNTWGLGYFTMWLDNVGDNGTVTASEERFRWERDGDFHADGDVIAYSTTTPSDIRLKTDIETIESASEKVSKLRGVEYTWSKGKLAGQREIGLIAQEVEAVVPEVVKEKKLPLWDDSGESYKTVDYDKLVALLIESNKEMQEEIKQLKERLDGFTK